MSPTPRALVRRLLSEDLARGAGVNVAFAGATALLAALSAVVAARYLGPEGVGIVALGFLLVEFMSVVDNVPTVGFMRDYSLGAHPSKVATVFVLKGAAGLGVSLLVALSSPLLARLLDVPLAIPLVFAFIPLASVADSVAIMSYEARRDMVRRNLPPLAEQASRLALYAIVPLAIVLPWERVTTIALATLLASVIGTLAGAILLPRFRFRDFDAAKAREYLSFGLRTQATGALQKIIFWIDILVIDVVLGHATQGLYKSAYQLMAYLPLAAGTVGIMLFPSIAAEHGRGNREAVRRTLSLGWFLGLAIALPLALVFLAVPEFVVVGLLGEAFAPAAPLLRALAAVGLLAVFLLPFEAFFPAVNRPDLSLRLTLVMVTINVGLDLLLIPLVGVTGAIVATAAAYLAGLALAVIQLKRLGYALPHARDLWRVLTG